jgi:hypothetical protein
MDSTKLEALAIFIRGCVKAGEKPIIESHEWELIAKALDAAAALRALAELPPKHS